MVTYQNAVCFVLGMAIVYMMFKMMRVYVIIGLLLLPLGLHAQTNWVAVQNWPFDTDFYSNSIPVTVVENQAPDYMPSIVLGMGFGFACAGFGWVLSMSRKVGNAND